VLLLLLGSSLWVALAGAAAMVRGDATAGGGALLAALLAAGLALRSLGR